ncbi:hypothetical protein DFP93_101301 [Aneurinibacillus soli]|uniref:Uncharacterized protein n=1 Tax=Aneurinibacillus soli TaxID=1500254 RepID=A0A0U5B1R1_9BACL|nr:hypothetical protein [Aneurinibacillus soli]PYE64275.1 hypothetical protein DFP93_101301 [Aneurinibacillus soli]BAU28224.1 hypothetical protein CB4_02398 [Aneurinibacillus soli]
MEGGRGAINQNLQGDWIVLDKEKLRAKIIKLPVKNGAIMLDHNNPDHRDLFEDDEEGDDRMVDVIKKRVVYVDMAGLEPQQVEEEVTLLQFQGLLVKESQGLVKIVEVPDFSG